MQVLVIGGAGFLGSHVVDELIHQGHDTSVFDQQDLTSAHEKIVSVHKSSMADKAALEEAIQGKDAIFIFAGIADIKEAHDHPYETIQTNVLYLTSILELCVKHQIKRVIYASTIYVYSNMGSFYKASKQCAEIIIESFFEEYNLAYSVLRYGSLYGPRANHFNFIHNAIKEALQTKKITRKGDGLEMRDYIHVVDAAVATVNQLHATSPNEYVMITGNQTMLVKDVLMMIREILENQVDIIFEEGELDGHYMLTPYYFKPKVAKKIVLPAYHDLGQGILQCIHEVYQEIKKEEPNS